MYVSSTNILYLGLFSSTLYITVLTGTFTNSWSINLAEDYSVEFYVAKYMAGELVVVNHSFTVSVLNIKIFGIEFPTATGKGERNLSKASARCFLN